MKRCVLSWLLLLLAAGCLWAEPVPSTSDSDVVFLWLAGGISSTRIERLAHKPQAPDFSALAAAQCHRALQKAGADSNLMQSLGARPAGNGLSGKSSESKSRTGVCSGAAAQIAALVHENNFNAAEDKIR
ncbi:MAG: hypothetical protein WCB56_02840, partial [Terriglobales bacterium]